jgi:hypothetical protein
MRTARADAARQARAIVVETMGSDSVAAQAIAVRLERQLADD